MQSFLYEIAEGDRLVALGRDVEQVDATLVLRKDVSAVFDQQADHREVPVKGSEVQSREGIFSTRVLVNPVAKTSLSLQFSLLFGPILALGIGLLGITVVVEDPVDQDLASFILVLIGCQLNG